MNPAFRWPPSFDAAVSLTYDDGLPIHADLVGPTLQRHGLRGTFYTPILSDLRDHPERWRQLARDGHELGNHTVVHPCRRIPAAQYAWLDPAYDLAAYSPTRLRDELATANLVLRLIDGRHERSLGTTCGHTTIGLGTDEQPIAPLIADLVVAARGAINGQTIIPTSETNLLDLGCISADGRSFSELQSIVETARAQRAWAVLMIHGVGPETHSLHIDPEVHAQFIAWLGWQAGIWVAPFIEIAEYIRSQQAQG